MRSCRCYTTGADLTLSAPDTYWFSFADGLARQANALEDRNAAETIWNAAGQFENLIHRLDPDESPGVGNAWILTLQINDIDTACIITIADLAIEGRYTGTAIDVAVNDRLKWKITHTGNPNDCEINWTSYEFVGDVAKQSCYSGVGPPEGIGSDPELFGGVFDIVADTFDTDEELAKNVSPLGGNLSILSILLTAIDLTGSFEGEALLRLNGVDQDGGGGTIDTVIAINTGTVAAGVQTTLSTTFTRSIVRTNDLSFVIRRTGGTGRFYFSYAISLIATIDGESVYCLTTSNTMDSSAIRFNKYTAPGGGGYASQDVAVANQIGGVTNFQLGKWLVELTTAPGAGNSWFYTGRKNQEDTSLFMEVNDLEVTAQDIIHAVSISDGDEFCFEIDPDSGPTVSRMRYGIVQMIEPTPPPPTTTGLFTPTPGQHNDEFNDANLQAIPTPFFVTALFGK